MKIGVRPLIACLSFSLLLSAGCSSKTPVSDEPPVKQTSTQQESAIQLLTLKKFDVTSTTVTDIPSQKMLGLEYTVQFAIPKKVTRDQIDPLGCQIKFPKRTWEVLGIEGSGVAQQLEPAGQDEQHNFYQVRFTHASTTLTEQQVADLIDDAKTDVVIELYVGKHLERTISVSNIKQ